MLGRPETTAASTTTAAGARSGAGAGLQGGREEAGGLDGTHGPPEALWCHGFGRRGSGQESWAAMADGGARARGRGCCGTGTSKEKEGKREGAHSELDGVVDEVGDALEPANPRRGCRRPEVEDEDGDDAAGLFRSRGLAETA